MNATKISGIVLVVLGLAGFFSGGFSYTKETTEAQLGPIQLNVKEKQSVGVPAWLSLGAIAVGAVLKYAVTATVSGIDIQTVGLILMIAGIVGLIISLLYMALWADRTRTVQDPRLDPPPPRERTY